MVLFIMIDCEIMYETAEEIIEQVEMLKTKLKQISDTLEVPSGFTVHPYSYNAKLIEQLDVLFKRRLKQQISVTEGNAKKIADHIDK